jgi:hypothetical protein
MAFQDDVLCLSYRPGSYSKILYRNAEAKELNMNDERNNPGPQREKPEFERQGDNLNQGEKKRRDEQQDKRHDEKPNTLPGEHRNGDPGVRQGGNIPGS